MSQLKYYNTLTSTWDPVIVGATGPTGPAGQAGNDGASGVISVTGPITNSGTSTSAVIGINQSSITIAESQVTNLTSDLALKAPLESPSLTGTAHVNNLVIDGALTFSGTATTINSTNLEVTDSLIYLSSDQYNTDAVDIGIYGAYGDTNPGHFHTGLIRDASDGKWKLISGGSEPATNVVDFTGVTYDTLKLGSVETASIAATGSVNFTGATITGIDLLPNQSGNTGKYLTTNGSTASWATLNASPALDDLSDVAITSATANDVVYFNGTSWVNKNVSAIPTLINAQSGTTYTLTLADSGKIVEVANASSISVSVPTDASVAFPIGTQITILQTGAGQITVSATTPATTTVNYTPGNKTRAQWSSATLVKRAANTWVLIGDLA